MLEVVLKIIDYLARLVVARESANDRVFDRIITPAYQTAEKVVTHYFQLFDEIKRMADAGSSREELATFLESKRLEYLTARIRLRDLMRRTEMSYLLVGDRFIRALAGILCGGLSTFEETQISAPYSAPGHTLLDMIYLIHTRVDRPLPNVVSMFTHLQRNAIDEAWKELTNAYNEMLIEVAAPHRVRVGRRNRKKR